MLQAFNNDSKIQEKYINRVKAHKKADEIIQGKYWENGKGCAVGCTIELDDVKNSHAGWHTRYEEALGIPRELAYLEDAIFERLSNGEAKEFPLRFLEAIKLGVDLSAVVPNFMIWLLIDPEEGAIKHVTGEDVKKVLHQVASLYKRKLNGETVTYEEWEAVRRAARAAIDAIDARDARDAIDAIDAIAARAAIDAIDARDARAAIDAIDAIAAIDAIDARDAIDAIDARAARAARANRYRIIANKLISLLREAN